ncbi:MAG TPA: nicotinate phosphoribosyltransferase [Victivallales bacterium]|nr:nicotinate phosphoribosyltransferase [Victivallales bacterium]
MKPIIKSLLDNDLYKFTMQQIFLHFEKRTNSKYEFICRTPGIDFSHVFTQIQEQVDHLCNLKFTEDELEYLNTLPYIKTQYLSYLKNFKLNRNNINIKLDKNKMLRVEIEAAIIDASMFEVPVLAIISELFSKSIISPEHAFNNGRKILLDKLNYLNSQNSIITFSDFGTRRRYSSEWHDMLINQITDSGYKGFLGTSNVYLSKKYNITPIGTMAHEWIMAHAGIASLAESNKMALNRWLNFYKGKLGIALTDTYTTDFFLSDFDNNLTKNYSGLRQDSGDWHKWGTTVIEHYRNHNIDPKEKTLIFSDSLNFELITEIYNKFKNDVSLIFGIGTHLTNDIGIRPLQIVLKMVECNNRPVIKISDSKEKTLCKCEAFKKKAIKYFEEYNKNS